MNAPGAGRARWQRCALFVAGAAVVALLLAIAILAPAVAPRDPLAMNPGARLSPPAGGRLLGSDQFGRDILSRVVHGSRVSLGVGVGAVALSLAAGLALGSVAAMREGVVDAAVMRSMDVLFAFPPVLLALALVAVLGSRPRNVVLAIGLVYTPVFARTVRAAVLTIRYREFVEAAHALGRPEWGTFLHHVLPNALAPVLVQASLSVSTAILAEAALSFLGIGIQPPSPSWGGMLSESRAFMEVAPWTAVFPGLAIMVAVLGFNLVGDGIRDLLDPRLRNL